MTRSRDELNASRRRLPMVKVDKEYVFGGPDGRGTEYVGNACTFLDMTSGARRAGRSPGAGLPGSPRSAAATLPSPAECCGNRNSQIPGPGLRNTRRGFIQYPARVTKMAFILHNPTILLPDPQAVF